MKLIVHVPGYPTRIYEDDFDESTIPNVGDKFDDKYIVESKLIVGDICSLYLKKKKWWV